MAHQTTDHHHLDQAALAAASGLDGEIRAELEASVANRAILRQRVRLAEALSIRAGRRCNDASRLSPETEYSPCPRMNALRAQFLKAERVWQRAITAYDAATRTKAISIIRP